MSNTLKDRIYEMYINGKDLKSIAKEINITKYNVKKILVNNFDISILRNKDELTRQRNYDSKFQEKCLINMYKSKPYLLPSGAVSTVQGYEGDFLDFIFTKTLLMESDVCFDKKFRIKYMDKGKIRHYYPDFYISKFNLIIEIKSAYTLEIQKELNDLKFAATKDAGYNFICIVDKNYEEFIKLLESLN